MSELVRKLLESPLVRSVVLPRPQEIMDEGPHLKVFLKTKNEIARLQQAAREKGLHLTQPGRPVARQLTQVEEYVSRGTLSVLGTELLRQFQVTTEAKAISKRGQNFNAQIRIVPYGTDSTGPEHIVGALEYLEKIAGHVAVNRPPVTQKPKRQPKE